jgi:hypothetical protein
MRRTGGVQDNRGGSSTAKQIQEIEELERKIKQWSFDVNPGIGSLPEVLIVEADIREVLDEEQTSVVIAEAEKLLHLMAAKYQDAARKHQLIENEIKLLETEIENKIIHRMDTEDVKYSIYRRLTAKRKAEVYYEAVDAYRSIVDSLSGLKELKQPGDKKAYLPVKKIIHSEFYTAKVKASLCYEACYEKLLQLNRASNKADLESAVIADYLRFKSSVADRLL